MTKCVNGRHYLELGAGGRAGECYCRMLMFAIDANECIVVYHNPKNPFIADPSFTGAEFIGG